MFGEQPPPPRTDEALVKYRESFISRHFFILEIAVNEDRYLWASGLRGDHDMILFGMLGMRGETQLVSFPSLCRFFGFVQFET